MGKKAHGEGSFYQRKDRPGWFGEFSVNGKRYAVSGATESECRANARVKRADIERGLQPATSWTFERYIRWWLEMKENTYRPMTFYGIRYFMEAYAIPAWGKIPLAKLAPKDFQDWLNAQMKKGELSPSTIRTYFARVQTAISYAVRTRMIPYNPCQYVELPRVEEGGEEMTVLTPAQAVQLVETVPAKWRNFFLFAIGTGARRNEIIACRWSDIDRKAGTWRVARNVTQIEGQTMEGKPKTKSSIRTIPLPQFVLDMLDSHEHIQKKERLKAGGSWEQRDLIFCSNTGGYLSVHRPNRIFQAALKTMELEHLGLTLHSLRHAVATWLFDDGQLPQEVQALLGHASLATTTGIYGHRMAGRNVQVMGRLNEIVQGESEGEEQAN